MGHDPFVSKMERLGGRIAELLSELVSREDYATGRRRYPRTVTEDDAAAIVEAFHEQVDRGTETRAELAKRRLVVIACADGCSTCCHEPIMITLPEAIVVARWLSRPENAAIREAYLARYPAWHAAVGEKLERLSELTAARRDVEGVALHQASRAMCPFNDQAGSCTIYPVRPVLCRDAHALHTSARCGGGDVPVEALPFAPLSEFVGKTKVVFWALHHALPGTGRGKLLALPAAVHALLTR
jgi:Fe-S-cluster containining protein